jgi:hypothetical protein
MRIRKRRRTGLVSRGGEDGRRRPIPRIIRSRGGIEDEGEPKTNEETDGRQGISEIAENLKQTEGIGYVRRKTMRKTTKTRETERHETRVRRRTDNEKNGEQDGRGGELERSTNPIGGLIQSDWPRRK